MIKVNIHSIVDVITNSSSVIYTYQNSIKETKELVQEILNLMNEDLTPDDIFYYGVFCDNDIYIEYVEEKMDEEEEEYEVSDFPKRIDEEWKEYIKRQNKWVNDLKLNIIKGDTEKPSWMEDAEDGGDYWNPDTYVYLHVKDKRFTGLADKISNLLNSVTADGGHEG